nr:PREDICTED: uncharacterized protein LOC109029809 [Bemisia tabaci]
MLLTVILCAAFVISDVCARAVPAAVSPEPATESVDKLLDDLKVIEKDRKAHLKKALRKPKFMADPNTMEKLSVFSMVDSLFIEYHNYYDAMNTLVHSHEKSTDSHEVLATIRSSRERLIQLYKAITAKQEKLHRPSKGPDSHMHLFTTIFKDTLRKNVEIEAQLRVEFENSPFIKHVKNIPNVSPI